MELQKSSFSSFWICCSRRWYKWRAKLCSVRGLFVRYMLPLFSHSYTRKRTNNGTMKMRMKLLLHDGCRYTFDSTGSKPNDKFPTNSHTHARSLTHVRARVFRVFSSHFSVPIRAVCWLTRSCCCCRCYCPDVRDFNDRRTHNFSSSLCFFMYAQRKVAMTRCALSHSRQFYMYRWSD